MNSMNKQKWQEELCRTVFWRSNLVVKSTERQKPGGYQSFVFSRGKKEGKFKRIYCAQVAIFIQVSKTRKTPHFSPVFNSPNRLKLVNTFAD